MRYTGPLGKSFDGDKQRAMDLQSRARVVVGRLLYALKRQGGLGQQYGTERQADGSVIHAYVLANIKGQQPLIRTWIESPVGSVWGSRHDMRAASFVTDIGLVVPMGLALPNPANIYINDYIRSFYNVSGAFVPSKTISMDSLYIGGDQAQLTLRKTVCTKIPPSIFTGRMRAFAQAKYGSESAYLFFPFPTGMYNYRSVYIDGELYGSEPAHSTGLFLVGDKCFVINITPTTITARKVVVSLPEDGDTIKETKAFADATLGTSVTVVVTGDIPHVAPIGWGWKFSWSGAKASCVSVRGGASAKSYTDLHTVEFSYDEENDEIHANVTTTTSDEFVFMTTTTILWGWAFTHRQYYRQNAYTTVDGTDAISCSVPIDCFYGKSEELTVVFYEVERQRTEESSDTGAWNPCSFTLTHSRCYFDIYKDCITRIRVGTTVVLEAPKWIGFSRTSYAISGGPAGGQVEWDFTADTFRGYPCGQQDIIQNLFGDANPLLNVTSHYATYTKKLIDSDQAFFSSPSVFIAPTTTDSEALYVGLRNNLQDVGYAEYRVLNNEGNPSVPDNVVVDHYTFTADPDSGYTGSGTIYENPNRVIGTVWNWHQLFRRAPGVGVEQQIYLIRRKGITKIIDNNGYTTASQAAGGYTSVCSNAHIPVIPADLFDQKGWLPFFDTDPFATINDLGLHCIQSAYNEYVQYMTEPGNAAYKKSDPSFSNTVGYSFIGAI